MHEVPSRNSTVARTCLSSLVIGAGAVFVIAGVIQLFCQSLEVRSAKRRRVRAELSLRKRSF